MCESRKGILNLNVNRLRATMGIQYLAIPGAKVKLQVLYLHQIQVCAKSTDKEFEVTMLSMYI